MRSKVSQLNITLAEDTRVIDARKMDRNTTPRNSKEETNGGGRTRKRFCHAETENALTYPATFP